MAAVTGERRFSEGKQISQKSWGVQLANGGVIEVNTSKQQYWILKGKPGAFLHDSYSCNVAGRKSANHYPSRSIWSGYGPTWLATCYSYRSMLHRSYLDEAVIRVADVRRA